MSKEFVDAIVSGNNIEAETAFKSSISTKVGDALEIKRKEYSKSFVSNFEAVEIEDEEIEEFEEEETSEGAFKGAVAGGAAAGLASGGLLTIPGAIAGGIAGHRRRKQGKDKYSQKALAKQKAGKKLNKKQTAAASARKKTLKKGDKSFASGKKGSVI